MNITSNGRMVERRYAAPPVMTANSMRGMVASNQMNSDCIDCGAAIGSNAHLRNDVQSEGVVIRKHIIGDSRERLKVLSPRAIA